MNTSANHSSNKNTFWNRFLDSLRASGSMLDGSLLDDSPESSTEAIDYLLMTLSGAYGLMRRSDPYYPEFLPFDNHVINFIGPNPDATYYYATISGKAAYRISGRRNSVHWVNFVTGYDFVGFAETTGQAAAPRDLDEFDINADGSFELLLSESKPADYSGNWMQMPEESNYILVRQFAYAPDEKDAELAIECLDAEGKAQSETELEKQAMFQRIADYLHRASPAGPMYMKRLGDDGKVNQFEYVDYEGTGEVANQIYQECLYDIAADQAMLLEIKPPESCRYWNLQLSDHLFRTQEFFNRLSSLNGHIDRRDGDGLMRLVISHSDPGVANWIDAGGVTQGHILIRWQEISNEPQTTLKLLALSELEQHLPSDTKRVSPEERAEQFRQWRTARQLRRIW